MTLQLNGEAVSLPEAEVLSLEGLLEHMGWAAERLAVEHNQVLVPRARWANTRVGDGDRVEVVHFVGGG